MALSTRTILNAEEDARDFGAIFIGEEAIDVPVRLGAPIPSVAKILGGRTLEESIADQDADAAQAVIDAATADSAATSAATYAAQAIAIANAAATANMPPVILAEIEAALADIATQLDGCSCGDVGAVPVGWALVELEIPNMPPKQNSRFFGVITDPIIPEVEAMTPDSNFPIQGTAYTATPQGYQQLLAFPTNGAETIVSTTAYASLRVDLRSLPTTGLVTIDLYGQLLGWAQEGAQMSEGYPADALIGSYQAAAKTKDFRGITVASPAALAGAPDTLFSEAHATHSERIYAAFPELVGMPVQTGVNLPGDGEREGDKSWTISFDREGQTAGNNPPYIWKVFHDPFNFINHAHYLGNFENVAGDDPNEWIIYPVSLAWDGTDASIQEKTYWTDPAGLQLSIIKTRSMNHINLQMGLENGNSLTVHNDPQSGRGGIINGFYQTEYFIPTWRFSPAQQATISGALVEEAANPWTASVKHQRANADSYTWGASAERPAMAQLGTVTVLSDEYVQNAPMPNRLGFPLLGTVTIDRDAGTIGFSAYGSKGGYGLGYGLAYGGTV